MDLDRSGNIAMSELRARADLSRWARGEHAYSDNVRALARVAEQELDAYGESSFSFLKAEEDLTMGIALEDSCR